MHSCQTGRGGLGRRRSLSTTWRRASIGASLYTFPHFASLTVSSFLFTHQDVHIQSKNSVIDQVKIYSDCLNPAIVEELEKALLGAKYATDGVRDAAARAKAALPPESAPQIDQFAEWLANSL